MPLTRDADIAELLANPEAARTLGERARARCLEQYSIERIGERLAEVVSRVAG